MLAAAGFSAAHQVDELAATAGHGVIGGVREIGMLIALGVAH